MTFDVVSTIVAATRSIALRLDLASTLLAPYA